MNLEDMMKNLQVLDRKKIQLETQIEMKKEEYKKQKAELIRIVGDDDEGTVNKWIDEKMEKFKKLQGKLGNVRTEMDIEFNEIEVGADDIF